MGNILGSKRGKYILKVANKGCFKNQGKYIKRNCLICEKEFSYFLSQRDRKYCSLKCYRVSQKGKKRPEHSKKMKGHISGMKGKKHSEITRIKLSGANSPKWKGGITTLYHKIRRLPEFDRWRLNVYLRDNFTCQDCLKSGLRLECHHLKSFSKILKENNIKSIKNALSCKELWDIKNGKTLCKECHKITDTYGKNQN